MQQNPAAYLASEEAEIGFLYSGWAQAALPHKRLPDDALWQVKNDRVTLIVQPGVRAVEDGPPVSVGGSCPVAWCSSLDPRLVRGGQAATPGSLTRGASLRPARLSRLMYTPTP